ncbi:lipopolysaccharide-induced tumor necrosis factor-alpha factor homolog isoform X2 [Anguilla rostrata]|uniref:lipopolysaccharide-induced tumor necrosis factor-alpha factor homolog isoform X2 n=1 Tax=Anguilla anguilla TaxID=7936 RepID=UPI0015B0F4D7|nr:lipopolysaccharide-induced tumor necrosis factor-alpha factor homolog isoform X2 [Anguilla anguilla]
MEKGQGPPQDVPPPYTGPPANYRGTESAPQPGFSVPPYQGAPNPVMYPPPTQGMGAAGVISFPPAGSQVHLISGLSDLPSQTQCPFCQTLVVSRTIPQPGLLTWLICGSLALVGCWPCCLIPFCVDGCQDVEHRCSNCNNLLFVYKRL